MLDPLKSLLSEVAGLSRDALHVHLGLLAMLGAMLIFRRPAGSPIPWLCVLALELLNEAMDLYWGRQGLRQGLIASAQDIINTMLWPTVILLLARYTRLLRR